VVATSRGSRGLTIAWEMIEPPPAIGYTIATVNSSQYLTITGYPHVHFHEGLRELSDEVFDGREQMLLGRIDDLMAEINQLVANIFSKISHRHDINIQI